MVLINVNSSTGNWVNQSQVNQCSALIGNNSRNSRIKKNVERLNLPLFIPTHDLTGINVIYPKTFLNAAEYKLSTYFLINYKKQLTPLKVLI